MAYQCTKSSRECDGCGGCDTKPSEYICPVCGRAVIETVYVSNGDIVGCDICVKPKDYWEVIV